MQEEILGETDKIVDTSKQLLYIITINNNMEGNMPERNKYILEGCKDDVINDENIMLDIKTKINDSCMQIFKYKDQGALAYYGNVLEEIVDKLDDINATIIEPMQKKIRDGDAYFTEKTDAT